MSLREDGFNGRHKEPDKMKVDQVARAGDGGKETLWLEPMVRL
jgi:hypothetical protein